MDELWINGQKMPWPEIKTCPSCSFPYHTEHQCVRRLSDGAVSVISNDGKMSAELKPFTWSINFLPADE